MIVYAKTQPDKGAKGITAFIVEKGMPVRQFLRGNDRCHCKCPGQDMRCPTEPSLQVLRTHWYDALISGGSARGMPLAIDGHS